MSSVSQVGAGSNLYDLLQNISDGSNSSASQTSGTGDGSTGTGSQTVEQSSGHHHHHGGGGGKGFQQIQSAVTDALQTAPDGSDPNQIIQNAIANALKASSTQQPAGQPAGANGSVTDPSESGTAAPDPDDFKSLLASYGVDQSQFQQDFQAAVKQSGVTFPTGSQTDVTA